MTVLIAGGGIGGLTLALSLHQIGVAAKVFESVAELKPLGVGINVLPHAVREQIELGLHDRLDASAVRTCELAYFSKHGKPIWSEPRGIEAGYKWPQFSIHRGTLQQILLDAAIERLGRENILTSHHLMGWNETADGVRAEFIDKATGKPAGAYEGALLIAADGIHSAVREKLYPQEGPPIWNGRILWRGTTMGDAFLTGRTMIMAGHETLKFVCYPISKTPDANGKHQINWVAERHMPPTYQWRREDYNRTARLDEFLPWFEDWKFDWLDVPGLIRNCPSDVPDRLQRRFAGHFGCPRPHPGDLGAWPNQCRAGGLRGRAPPRDHRSRDAQPPQRARAGDAAGRGACAQRV